MNKEITVQEQCFRCESSWTCQTLSDSRTVMTTELASTFILGTIEGCQKRLKELAIPHFGFSIIGVKK